MSEIWKIFDTHFCNEPDDSSKWNFWTELVALKFHLNLRLLDHWSARINILMNNNLPLRSMRLCTILDRDSYYTVFVRVPVYSRHSLYQARWKDYPDRYISLSASVFPLHTSDYSSPMVCTATSHVCTEHNMEARSWVSFRSPPSCNLYGASACLHSDLPHSILRWRLRSTSRCIAWYKRLSVP